MGTLHKSVDPDMKFPSSLLFGSDLPVESDTLLNDICTTVIVRRGLVIDHFTYEEWEWRYNKWVKILRGYLK